MKDRGAATSACVLIAWLCAIPCAWPGRAGAEEPAPPAAAAGEAGDQGDDPLIGEKRLSELLVQLRHQNKGIQLRAAKALIEAPAELRPKMMPKMMALLKSERENDKYVAAQVLGGCGPAARAAVPDLLPMLQGTQYERNRAAAAKALGQILKDAQPSEEVEKVTKALVAVFRDKYPDVQRESVYACGMIGPAAKSCLPHLVEPLEYGIHYSSSDGPYFQVRTATVWTLSRMGPLAAGYMDRLIARLHYEGSRMPGIVEAMGSIGPVNDNVIPNIIDVVEGAGRPGDCAGFKVKAFETLAKFGEKSAKAVPVMRRFLRDTTGNEPRPIQEAILKALPAMGAAAKEAAPEILSYARQDRDKGLREEAAKAYKAIMGREPPAGDEKK
jgi:hypothetical protein